MKLTLIKNGEKQSKSPEIEPVVCLSCGERIGYGLEVVIAPVKRKGGLKWIRKGSKRGLVCLPCFRDGKTTISAE